MATVSVPLTRGKVALIDAEDAPRVLAHEWRAYLFNGRYWYAYRHHVIDGKKRLISLHRFVMDAPPGMLVDHIDGDGLNCVRSNLRLATNAQNVRNSRLRTDNTSGYRGVSWDARQRKWVASIRTKGQRRRLGSFVTPDEAARVYDAAARQAHGEFARLNFPDQREACVHSTSVRID